MAYKKQKEKFQEIAIRRIDDLFLAAEKLFFDADFKDLSDEIKHEYANKYVAHARNLSTKLNVTILPKYKKQFCKHCYTYLRPGDNARVRLNAGKLVYSCFSCKKFTRQPLH